MRRGRSVFFGSHFANGGVIAVFILVPILHALEYCSFIAIPFGNENEVENIMYWVILLAAAVPVVPWIVFIIGISIARLGAVTAAMALFVVAAIYQAFAFIYSIIVFATCDGDLQCAANLRCDGTVYKPYNGPTVRFVVAFSAMVAMFFGELVAVFVLFSVRRVLRELTRQDALSTYHSPRYFNERNRRLGEAELAVADNDAKRAGVSIANDRSGSSVRSEHVATEFDIAYKNPCVLNSNKQQ
jgi:hypothetical protein